MTDPSTFGDDWIKAWIEGQRTAIQQWTKGQSAQLASGATGVFADFFARLATTAERMTAMAGLGTPIATLWQSMSPSGGTGSGSVSDLPGLGPLREQQEILQGLAQAIAEFQRLSGEMATVLAGIHSETLDLLARRSLEQTHSGTPLESFKALYALWIECGEATYAKVAHGESYCRLQSNLCNAGIRVQSHQQQLLERWLRQLDLPTRSELNTLNRRIQELHRRLDTVAAATGEQSPSKPPIAPRRTVKKPAPASASGTGERPQASRKTRKKS